ncbi:MAG: arylformamidase [Arcticibacterium sp.]|jgi:arylformamidase
MKIVDLTLTYSPQIAGFNSESAKTVARDGWNASTLHLYSHSGTHMDSPFHFEVNDQKIDEFPVDRFVSKAWVVPIEIKGGHQLIQPNDFRNFESKIDRGDSLIIKTGWAQFVGQEKYRNELPRFSEAAANWIVEKGINILAVEPCSVADVNNLPEVTRIHQILLGGDVIIVEGLCNTEALTSECVELIALPLKILGGDGAPARVIARWD